MISPELGQPAGSREGEARGQTARLSAVWQEVQLRQQPEEPHEDTHWGVALQLRAVRSEFQASSTAVVSHRSDGSAETEICKHLESSKNYRERHRSFPSDPSRRLKSYSEGGES